MARDMTILTSMPAQVEVGLISNELERSTDLFVPSGISVSHTPDINIYAVADTTIFLMIGALRQITAPSDALRRGPSLP